MRKDEVVAYLKALFQHSPEAIEENYENFSQDSRYPDRYLKVVTLEYEAEELTRSRLKFPDVYIVQS
jgi:hypothetical protein